MTAAFRGELAARLAPIGAEAPPRAGAELHPAAVLVPLVERALRVTVLLTQRTEHLSHHAGQISFPGGRVEPRDRGAVDTALREWERRLPPREFARIHRSTIVHIRFVAAMESTSGSSYRLRLRDSGDTLAISRRYAAKLKKVFGF